MRTDGTGGERGLELPQDLVPQAFERIQRDDPRGLRPRRRALDEVEPLGSSAASQHDDRGRAERGGVGVVTGPRVERVLEGGAVRRDRGEGVDFRAEGRREDAWRHRRCVFALLFFLRTKIDLGLCISVGERWGVFVIWCQKNRRPVVRRKKGRRLRDLNPAPRAEKMPEKTNAPTAKKK